jgi:signal transduction histidine kinase
MYWTFSDILALLFVIGCLAWFAAVLRRRMRAPAFREMPITGRLRALGLGILLLPVVVAVATLSTADTAVLLPTAAALALAGWTFLPRSVTSKVVPIALVGAGISTFFAVRLYLLNGNTLNQYVPVPSLAYQGVFPRILLLQGHALIVGGLWLTWRAIDKNGLVGKLVLRERPRVSGQPGRPRWGLLLLVLVALLVELLGRNFWFAFPWWTFTQTAGVALVALFLVIRFPAVAADLAPAGFVLFGLYGIAIGAAWPIHVPLPSPYTEIVRYGPVWVDNRLSAFGAGFVGLASASFGLWLAPRALDDKTRALFRSAADADLASRVVRLTRTRADAVDSATSQLRRLERDLHDGAQARLVALGMSLRAAEYLIPTRPEVAATLVAEARMTSAKVLDELRDLVRGICPPVLADRGLADAVKALALDTAMRTEVDIDLSGRPDLPVETACYFAVAEALTNAVKHSGARQVQIRVWYADGSLRITVIDDGCGGADTKRGTGLLGLEQRLAAFDGVLALNSPSGGPTIVAIEVPCSLSPQKVSH